MHYFGVSHNIHNNQSLMPLWCLQVDTPLWYYNCYYKRWKKLYKSRWIMVYTLRPVVLFVIFVISAYTRHTLLYIYIYMNVLRTKCIYICVYVFMNTVLRWTKRDECCPTHPVFVYILSGFLFSSMHPIKEVQTMYNYIVVRVRLLPI